MSKVEEALLAAVEEPTSILVLQQRKNYYLFIHDDVIYDVFEYEDYDGDEEAIVKKISVYLHEECEEIVDKDLEQVILSKISELSTVC